MSPSPTPKFDGTFNTTGAVERLVFPGDPSGGPVLQTENDRSQFLQPPDALQGGDAPLLADQPATILAKTDSFFEGHGPEQHCREN